MYRNHTIGVVIPAYNEAGLIGRVIDTVPDYVDRIYAIDDRSTDDTWAEIQAAAAAVNRRREAEPQVAIADGGQDASHVVAMRNEVNQGRGASVKRGYKEALADGMDIVAVMDGDGQMDPAVLDRILDPVVERRADYAKGNRLANGAWDGMSRFRLFGNMMLSFLTKLSSGYWEVSDSQNGYAAISRDALEELDIDDLYEDYGFENDILAKLNLHDMRVADVPHPAVYGEETSTIKYNTFIPRVSMLLLGNFVHRMQSKYFGSNFHPVAVCYALGVLAVLAGVVTGAFTLLTLAEGTLAEGMLSVVVFLFGALSLVLALAFDVRLNAHLAADPEA